MDKVITTVRPGTASRGKTCAVQLELNPENARRTRVPPGKPSWTQIGPFEAKKISREGNVVTVEIEIPDDSPVGVVFDCHIEFDGSGGRGGPIVFKKNDVFRVIE